MYAKAFVTLLLPILAAHAMPAKRDEYDDALSLITAGDTDPTASAELNSILSSPPTGTALAALEASIILDEASLAIHQLPSASESQFTAYITTIAGAPVVEVSSIGGPAITVATSTAGAATTFFAGHTVFVVPGPGKKNGASELKISRPLLTGMVGALGAVAAGAMMIL
ncbi:uncharacterized protein TRAVEDRAFT_46003 [Trametes versicolor FP-101664 SS1]|uniref:uncharacterized protein n=1 Tax=Trametes versicolor (strain FP-101664) TaxID=717944 RepID=UPI00046241C4|nr:uncharacterized protein TRAVEDRAFT_46003 [Trametes versicolor FP-101664 SS1]EIW60759.1 hypothetical protein TRAVEDRAFT_46003 [Trametes versicolor FP-101664 SS1]